MKTDHFPSEFPIIAGPCVIEDEGLCLEIAQELKTQVGPLLAKHQGTKLYFKASFDKANRSSIDGFRGPGLDLGLKILERVREKTGLPLCTDFHETHQAEKVAAVVDFMQIPAFLCRQTDLIVAGAEAAIKYNRKLNVKKGQFLAPWDTKNIVDKIRAVEAKGKQASAPWFYLCERGVSFGYNTLVVDMTGIQTMQSFGVPVIYDSTHSVQQPGGAGKSTGGKRENIEVLSRAAIAAGANGIFLECHPRPDQAKSDGPNAFPLQKVGDFLSQILKIHSLVKDLPKVIG